MWATCLDRTPIFERYVARLMMKADQQKDKYSGKIGLRAINSSKFNCYYDSESLCNHLTIETFASLFGFCCPKAMQMGACQLNNGEVCEGAKLFKQMLQPLKSNV